MIFFKKLFKPAWQSNNLEKAIKSVEKITNEEKLALIIETAPLEKVRGKARLILSDIHFEKAKMLVFAVKDSSQAAMALLFNDKANWGSAIMICFWNNVLMYDDTDTIKRLIAKIAVANHKERLG